MPNVLKTWILLWILTCGILSSCSNEEREDKPKANKSNTNVCGADWAGDRGDLVSLVL